MLRLYGLEDSLTVDLDLLIGYAVDLHGVRLYRRSLYNSDPVVPALLFHGLDLGIAKPVVIRQVQRIAELAVGGVELEVDLHGNLLTQDQGCQRPQTKA